jgi:hypothetical protein
MILLAGVRAASAPDVRSTYGPAAPNERATGARCSVGTRLTLAFLCILLISVGCIYFSKSRKKFRCQRVADSMGETTATLGCVSKLRGSHHLPL